MGVLDIAATSLALLDLVIRELELARQRGEVTPAQVADLQAQVADHHRRIQDLRPRGPAGPGEA